VAPGWLLCDFTVIKSIVNCFIIPDSNSLFPLILSPPLQKSYGVDPQEVRERATVLQTQFENYVHSSEGTIRWAKKGRCISSPFIPVGLISCQGLLQGKAKLEETFLGPLGPARGWDGPRRLCDDIIC